MIVAAAARLRQQYDRLAESGEIKNRVSQIESTRERLVAIEPHIREPLKVFGLTHDRLPAEDRERVGERLRQLQWMIRQSREDFARDRRQVRRLEEAAASAGAIVNDLNLAWRRAATLRSQPFRDLMVLVRQLPAVAAEAQALQRALKQLDPSIETAPRSPQDLSRYDERMREVEHQAQAFEALPLAVREFLRRVTEETATLADLSPDIVDWLQQQGHLQSLAVRFAGGGP